jgi:hypothetical protein
MLLTVVCTIPALSLGQALTDRLQRLLSFDVERLQTLHSFILCIGVDFSHWPDSQ